MQGKHGLNFTLIFPLPCFVHFWKLRFYSSLEDSRKTGPHPPTAPQVLSAHSQVATVSREAATYSR